MPRKCETLGVVLHKRRDGEGQVGRWFRAALLWILRPMWKGLGFYSDGSEEAVRGFKDVGWQNWLWVLEWRFYGKTEEFRGMGRNQTQWSDRNYYKGREMLCKRQVTPTVLIIIYKYLHGLKIEAWHTVDTILSIWWWVFILTSSIFLCSSHMPPQIVTESIYETRWL